MKNPKRLVVFCDGTWNHEGEKKLNGQQGRKLEYCPTNVVKLFQATAPLALQDFNQKPTNMPQVLHYVEGVGVRWLEKLTGGGLGYGISEQIMSGYRFLASNWQPGDEIFLFGFSRGAFTARSLAGMITNVGILQRKFLYKIEDAYKVYKNRKPYYHPRTGSKAKEFRDNYCYPESCRNDEHEDTPYPKLIQFIGLWDTVRALGAPFGSPIGALIYYAFKSGFHDSTLSPIIASGCHAVSIDEKRWPFRPTLWDLHKEHDEALFQQEWFPGVHSNVGGGYLQRGLSDLSLWWVARKAQQHGLAIDDLEAFLGPAPNAAIMEATKDSQNLAYRGLALLFARWPAYISPHLVFMGAEANKESVLKSLDADGNYQRPIGNPAGPVVKISENQIRSLRPIADGNMTWGQFEKYLVKHYNNIPFRGSLSLEALAKMKCDSHYRPANVLQA